jgi:NADH:ubiquinone oxidoreductase subunit 5 (subunit L)/multisubunit Na+/H+ antiporter MnhA subunit
MQHASTTVGFLSTMHILIYILFQLQKLTPIFPVCGMPFLAGFYSRDFILEMFSIRYVNMFGFFILFLSMGLTVCYSFCLFYFVLCGDFNFVRSYSVVETSYNVWYNWFVPYRRCLHFEVVGGLEWSNDPDSYAGSSVATGRASLARKVKGDDPD